LSPFLSPFDLFGGIVRPQLKARASAGLLVVAVGMLLAPAAADAAKPRVFKNCTAVNKVYPHGIAKNFKVIKTANGLTGRPFVGTNLYAAQPRALDRDKDGVACET
jgi:hypothetical protein